MSDTTFTLITRLTDAELRALPGGTLPELHRRGQAEAQLRQPGSSATLVSVTMSNQVAPPFDGATILSCWQLREPSVDIFAQAEAGHAEAATNE